MCSVIPAKAGIQNLIAPFSYSEFWGQARELQFKYMIFSTKSTYGLRAMINLAKHKSEDSVPLSIIAKDEKISLKYLERLFASLKKAELVKSVKGAGGGYKLAKQANRIVIYDIIKALEGKLSPFHCLDEQGKVYCSYKCNCGVTAVLTKVQQSIDSTLKNIKLSQLL